MKKLVFVASFLLLTAVFTAPLSVSAAENAGIKPGSFLYGFVTTFEKVNLFFTFNPEKKAEKALKYAEKHLAEAEAVAGDKNSNAVKTAISGYEENIALAAEASKKVKDETKVENLLNLIAENTSKHQTILSDVLSKVPDEAREAITKAIEASKKGQEEALKQIQELNKTITGQSAEIEALRKEVEALKSRPSQTPLVISSPKITQKLSNAEIIRKIKPTIVYVETNNSVGSGMILSVDGFILTNAHVISGVSSVQIKLFNSKTFSGVVVGRDENIDLALLKINTDNVSAIELGNSDDVQQGDEVFALGYPFGLEGDVSFKEGTISRRIENYLETSAEMHPGNSGGPLVNRYGQVIGVNTKKIGKGVSGVQIGETIKLAIPINIAKDYIPKLKSGINVINVVDGTKNSTHIQLSCEKISDAVIAFDTEYNILSKSYLDISKIFSDALSSTSLKGLAAFKYWYNNWVAMHDQISLKTKALQEKARRNYVLYIEQDNLISLNTAFAQTAIYSKGYYDARLETLNFIVNNDYWDDYFIIKIKDLLAKDNEIKQKADDSYEVAKLWYKNIQNDYIRFKTDNGCSLKMAQTIRRSVLDAMTLNPQLRCSDLGFSQSDINSCSLYRNYSSYYDWKIIEDNQQ